MADGGETAFPVVDNATFDKQVCSQLPRVPKYFTQRSKRWSNMERKLEGRVQGKSTRGSSLAVQLALYRLLRFYAIICFIIYNDFP